MFGKHLPIWKGWSSAGRSSYVETKNTLSRIPLEPMRPSRICLFISLFLGTTTCARETVHDAARIARNLVEHSSNSVGSVATVFPSNDPRSPDMPFSLPEYYASCHQNGSLTLLFLPISQHSQNILHSTGHTASFSITSSNPIAAHPRVALIGNVTIFRSSGDIPDLRRIRQCYLSKHPDARWWLPDDDEAAHIAYWARFDPHRIYFVGGFGDEHYIGYIPLQLYQATEATAYDNHGIQQILRESGGD